MVYLWLILCRCFIENHKICKEIVQLKTKCQRKASPRDNLVERQKKKKISISRPRRKGSLSNDESHKSKE